MKTNKPELEISPIIFAQIYAELVECYHGVNEYGSTVAEIYAYSLSLYYPSIHNTTNWCEFTDGQRMHLIEEARNCAKKLVYIIEAFKEDYNCVVKIDGVSVKKWLKDSLENSNFDMRAHVEVIKGGR